MPASGHPAQSHASRHGAVPAQGRAMRSPLAVAVFLVVLAGALAGDLLSKHYVFAWLLSEPDLAARVEVVRKSAGDSLLGPRETLHELNLRRTICPGLNFTLSVNKGAVFGIEFGSPAVHRTIVGLATAATTVLVLYFFAFSHRRARVLHLSMAFIVAGALGNLYDRLTSSVALPGTPPIRYNVRDFIDCSEIPLPFGFRYVWVFNIADALLVVGIAVLILHWLIAGRKAKQAAKA